MLPLFDTVHHLGTPNGIVEDVLIGEVHGTPVGFACVYGAAMASEIVHLFGVLGTRTVIQIGNCGALADGFEAGDLFVAERAFCGEGAAQYYATNPVWVTASESLLQHASLADIRRGPIYTTGALFAESLDDVERWRREGYAEFLQGFVWNWVWEEWGRRARHSAFRPLSRRGGSTQLLQLLHRN